jgi:hypothetical protein
VFVLSLLLLVSLLREFAVVTCFYLSCIGLECLCCCYGLESSERANFRS